MPNNSDQRKHILAINDDPAILQLFDDLLSEEGYRVTLDTFNRQTTDLLGVIRELQPDLVVMDYIIGGEAGGWQLLQAARMDRAVKHIPVIICTGAVKQVTEMSEQLDSLGVQVVFKPFDIDHLIEVIDKVWLPEGLPTTGPDALGAEAYEENVTQ